jgi:putative transposase
VQFQRHACDQGRCRPGGLTVVLARTLAFVIVRRAIGLVGLVPTPDAKDVEIAVLRHQLMVLRRQVARPRYTRTDLRWCSRLWRGCCHGTGGGLPRHARTVLRWHRDLVRRR